MEDQTFKYPSTRYSGSKRRLLDWIWLNIDRLKFESVLDVFGGTGSVSLLFKRHSKRVYYNDLLKFNQIIGTAIIENKTNIVTDEDLDNALSFNGKDYPKFIQNNFKGIFYLNNENAWLDKAITNFSQVRNKYKRAILLSALFQACLAKRPFNLFHRANLNIRTNEVDRSFGNKTTWERPFEYLIKKYVYEYNKSVFNNGKENKVIGGYDALNCPNGVDLVYLDPPYFSASSSQGTNYLAFYHFLEGLANYNIWSTFLGCSGSKTKRISDPIEVYRWIKKDEIYNTFKNLIKRFQDSIIVLSYQSEGIPSKDEIYNILRQFKKKARIFSKPHRYVLSCKTKKELLFIAR
jgi:adenine-specific DNA-methyltransferase